MGAAVSIGRCICFVGVAFALSGQGSAAVRLCDRLRSFQSARFPDDLRPRGRRWIELHWRGHWMNFDEGWGFTCLHSADQAAAQLCEWMTNTASYEFPALVPEGILRCYGYVMPGADTWSDWKATIGLDREARFSLLEIDFGSFATETGAIRLSSFEKGYDAATAALPAIKAITGSLEK